MYFDDDKGGASNSLETFEKFRKAGKEGINVNEICKNDAKPMQKKG